MLKSISQIITLVTCDINAEGSKENHSLINLCQPDCSSAAQAGRAHGRAWTFSFRVHRSPLGGMQSASCCGRCRPHHSRAPCPVQTSVASSVLWDTVLLLSCPKLRKAFFFLSLQSVAKLLASKRLFKRCLDYSPVPFAVFIIIHVFPRS